MAMQFPAKITSSCHTCMLVKLFYIGMPVVRTEGRSVARSGGERSRDYQVSFRPPQGRFARAWSSVNRSSNDMTSLSIAIT